jgi:hypothetical protein
MDLSSPSSVQQEPIHWGHFRAILFVAVLLLGVAWLKNPQLFSVLKFQKNTAVADAANVPHYYPYVPSAQDQQAEVLGASIASTTAPAGPMIINEDGSVTPALTDGQVLAASTQNVVLTLDDVKVNQVPDSPAAIQNYVAQSQNIEGSGINNSDFEVALESGDQTQINVQAAKLQSIEDNLQKLSVPASFVKLQQLTIIQYQAGVELLNNFTQADQNPELVGQELDQFLKAQSDMDVEAANVEKEFNIDLGYPTTDPDAVPASDNTTDNGQ